MLLPVDEEEKIAARIPNNPQLLSFLELIGEEIISTSANISGKSVCATAEEIKYTFNETVYGVLDLPLGGEKGPSRILDVETNEYRR
jgi:tRNA A37 threonylcarbamoyladenosine synthetase subunit TsaC/SUA5/YrdC